VQLPRAGWIELKQLRVRLTEAQGFTVKAEAITQGDHLNWWRRYVFSTDHKVIGIQYLVTGFLFILFAFCLMMLMRWQLPYPGQELPVIGKFGGVLWQVLLAIVYGIAGIYMLMNPLLGVLSLTLLLAVFLLAEGILEIALYFRIRRVRHGGWILFDGIVTLILGILIWAHWPSSSVWVIGTLVGISLMFSGISRFTLSLAVRDLSPTAA
jgi:heme/copper-type cytochrome/quinol oxidase subunit 1